MSAFDGSTFVERNGIVVPDTIPEKITAKCPAATVDRYKDTGRVAIKCGVANESFAVESNPVGALGWCCGDYQDCPIWKAAKDGDPIVERQRIAREAAAVAKLTREQIASGMRVDDQDEEGRLQMQEHLRPNVDPERDAYYRGD